MKLNAGETIGKYEILSTIGKGGMGVVYQVRHIGLNKTFAMKILRTEFTDDEDVSEGAIERFQKEAQITARLNHPHIVPVTDCGYSSKHECYYLVMDYIEGTTLLKYHATPFKLEEAIRIVKDVATALAYAHERGVIHRDIKPSNILIDQTGKVWLTDFGIAKAVGETTMTVTGAQLGTAKYMSPEQAKGAKNIDG